MTRKWEKSGLLSEKKKKQTLQASLSSWLVSPQLKIIQVSHAIWQHREFLWKLLLAEVVSSEEAIILGLILLVDAQSTSR